MVPSAKKTGGRGITLFTIGFAGKSAEEFFSALKQAGVRTILDVRLSNSSQLAGFTKKNDLIYEPSGLKVLQIETLCDDRSILHGILSILFPDKHWMKKVYGSCGLLAHMKHFLKVL